jgi:hypothetical protein
VIFASVAILPTISRLFTSVSDCRAIHIKAESRCQRRPSTDWQTICYHIRQIIVVLLPDYSSPTQSVPYIPRNPAEE